MYAPIAYPAKKLEFSIKQVFNITEYMSTDVLQKINDQAAFRARKRQRSLELCYFIICRNIFDQFPLIKSRNADDAESEKMRMSYNKIGSFDL